MSNRESLLYLNAIGLNHDELNHICSTYENLDDIINNSNLLSNEYLIERGIKRKLEETGTGFDFDRYRTYMDNNEINYTTIYDPEYPKILKNIDDNPKLLYIKGCLNDNRPGIAVVGSRKCTEYGKWAVKKLVSDLGEYGVNIISGLALGVDKLAHVTAMNVGLKTIGVLGCGVDIIYPSSNRNVYERILEDNGAVISEFRLETPPLPFHFPLRNRIISGLSIGLLIIEAKEKSGTLITANYAATQGKEVFSLPGNINSLYSKGTNALIRDGAKIITNVNDIVDELPELKAIKENIAKINKDLSNLSDEEKIVYEQILVKSMSVDELSQSLKLQVSEILSVLTLLELKGMASEVNSKWIIEF